MTAPAGASRLTLQHDDRPPPPGARLLSRRRAGRQRLHARVGAAAADRSLTSAVRRAASVGAVDEVLPGVFHWTAIHPRYRTSRCRRTGSTTGGVLLDPLLPPEAGRLVRAARHAAGRDRPHQPPALPRQRRARRRVRRAGVRAARGLHQFADRGAGHRRTTPATRSPAGSSSTRSARSAPTRWPCTTPTARILVIADGVVRLGPGDAARLRARRADRRPRRDEGRAAGRLRGPARPSSCSTTCCSPTAGR